MIRVLIVDDDASTLASISRTFRLAGHEPVVCDNAARAIVLLQQERFDIVFSDVVMPGKDGLSMLADLRELGVMTPIIMISGQATVDMAVRATRLGALDFLEKPISAEKLLLTVENALKLVRLEEENRQLRRRVGRHDVIWASDAMQRVMAQVDRVAPTESRVCILGETGTGKELVARAVHERSARRERPFVTVNCAAVPTELIESELFGHEKGAFAGALARRIGKFEEAKGGTLLLDEISEMDVRLQAKLLRAIQERVIDRVGGNRPVPVDIRIIATSNRNLTEAVREGRFREDLMFRLNVVNLKIPPLHERPSDIGELAEYFTKKYSRANGLPLRPLSTEARRALNINRWPGNVRELENTLHRAVLLSSGAEIGVDGILSPDGARLDQARGTDLAAHAVMAAEQITRNLVGRTVAEVERDLILETLKHCLGNRTRAANILGISIRTLRNKLNEYAADGSPIPPPHGSSELKGAA
jgi:DNA-binding NtrC family response regulator